MKCFKHLGAKEKAKTFEQQVVELKIRAFTLNQFTALSTPQTGRWHITTLGIEQALSSVDLCNKTGFKLINRKFIY